MKKILFVIPTMRMGGAEQSLVSLLNSMNLKKYEIDVFLFEKDGILLDKMPKGVNIIEADAVTKAMLLEGRLYLKDILKRGHIMAAAVRMFLSLNNRMRTLTGWNLVFSWSLAKHFINSLEKEYDVAIGYLEDAADYFVIDKVKAKKKVGWIHIDFSKQKRNYKAEYKYYKAFDEICTISDICRDSFLKYYPEFEQKIRVIENITNRNIVLEKADMTIEAEFKGNEKCIVTVGRLEEQKGIDFAIEAAEILKNRDIDFKWHVFGTGTKEKELREMIVKKKLEQIFILEGVTKNPYPYMKAADIIVQSSRYEGKSIVLDEAKILAKPIVTTNYPSVGDQIQDGVTGIIVDINPEAIAEGIEKLISDDKLRTKLSENCLKGNDNTSEIIKKIEQLID